MHKSFELLGYEVKDVVTGITGICDSICFDLYGCIQAAVRPQGPNEKGEPKLAHWFNVKRLVAVGLIPVMTAPDFSKPEIGSAAKAPR
ncbi:MULTISPECIES: hypothetical protein [unclassified Bradyrhizobium]|uniref:hypothetical protein n=1 Tax=unclassified Bradyrhizobium TaxID=2631580 RepID=UPI001FF9C5CE|nr:MULTISPECIES: hypothetical protein [unclassified Bradyrhizobium]MCK1536850.1 hypothetical protein [Bradyrhizobium sp. 176]MCK1560153.1 hypothetical protein [Bradyrhizobium sp. 171]